MNALDKVIGYFNPNALERRLRARYAVEALSTRRYDAATKGRRTSGWNRANTSANTEISRALVQLRDTSRDMTRNNVWARRAIRVISNNVVGSGIVPSPQGSKALNKKLMQIWKEWAEKKKCDFDSIHNIYGLQKLVMRSIVESGEAIIRKRRSTDKNVPIELQVVESDYLDHLKNADKTQDGGWITMGVEFDSNGKRVAYWLYDKHPADGATASTRISATEVAHVYFCERPGQVRGVPFGVASMLRLNDFNDFEDAELVKQKIAACYTAFVSGDADGSALTEDEEEEATRMEPGAIEYLSPGKTVTMASPPQNNTFPEFSRKILLGAAAGYDMTYEALTGDLSNVNYSSGRMGWLEFHRSIEDWQWNMMIPMFCDIVWGWFMDALIVSQTIRETQRVEASWTPPRRQMIDPSKEVKGMSDEVRNGFKSWSEVVRESGYNPDDVLTELASDFKKFDDAGVKLACDPRWDAGKTATVAEGSASANNSETGDGTGA
jgi:lambda family phage portal protein